MLYGPVSSWICRKFNMTHEDLRIEGPVLLVPNHVNAWDPLLVATSLRHKHVYFVASEHIFRLGFISKLIVRLLDPIPRSKAASGAGTVKTCLRRIKAGESIALFAEGDCTWDGLSAKVFKSFAGKSC